MTIDELRSAAAIVRDATEEGENTATRIGQLFLDVVNTLCNVATNVIKGYVLISSTSELPASPTADQQMLGYLLGTVLYVYVGTGGDTLDGKYQSAQLKGETGDTGPAGADGADGHDGVSLGDVVLVNDLTTGGGGAALSAEMGKVLNTDGYYFMPQLFAGGNMQTNVWQNSQYCSTSVSDGVLTLTPNSTTQRVIMRKTGISSIAGHIYFLSCKFKSTKSTSVQCVFGNSFENSLEADADWKVVSGTMSHPGTGSSSQLYIYFASVKLVSGETNYVKAKDFTMIDLTAVFGIGNEPTANEVSMMLGSWQSTYKVKDTAIYDILAQRIPNDIDMDLWFPLSEGSYTPQSAINALPMGYNKKGFALKFVDEDGNHVRMKYKSTNINEAGKNGLTNWAIEGDGEAIGVEAGTIVFPTTNGYYLPKDENNIVAGGDWYMEFFMESTSAPGVNTFFLTNIRTGSSEAALLRYNASELQAYINAGTSSEYFLRVSRSKMANGAHHLYIAKQGTTITSYIDGVQVYQVTNYTIATTLSYMSYFQDLSYWKLYMVRIGIAKTDVQGQMFEHWNGGDVLGYKCTEDDMVLEINRFGKTYAIDNVRDAVLQLTNGSLVTSPAYEREILASGAPSVHPQYIGQRYYDTVNKRYYRAVGYTNISDWKAFAYKDELDGKQDSLVSGTTIMTINGTSILGAGNLEVGEGGGGSSASNLVNVVDYGATGNGVTDDSTAIMTALEVARASRSPLYFPANGGNCTYLTRKGLVLTTGMKVTADKGAVLKNASAVLKDVNNNAGTGVCAVTTLTASASQGATSVVVASNAGLAVGQEVTIINTSVPSYQETLADITAINGNTITIDTSRFTASGENEGVLYALSSGAYLMTDFSLIKTCIGKAATDIEIENITLQACGNTNEPYVYTISPINQTKQGTTAQQRIYIHDVTIDGSVQDGISTQGGGDVWIEDCIVKNVRYKGIHYGTSCDRINIRGNYLYNCGTTETSTPAAAINGGSGGIYWCVNNHRVLIEGNHFDGCYRGVFGFDYRGNGETDTDSIVANNTFTNCTKYGVNLKGGYRIVVQGNVFRAFTGSAVPILVENEGSGLLASVISNNVIGGFNASYTNTSGAIVIAGANQLAVNGNVIQKNSSASGSFDIVVTDATKVLLTGNIVGGAIDISDTDNSGCVALNNITES